MGVRVLQIQVPSDFRLDLTAWTLRRRAHNAIDTFEQGVWRRSLRVGDVLVHLTARQHPTRKKDSLEVSVEGDPVTDAVPGAGAVTDLLTAVLGLGVEMAGFYALGEGDPQLQAISRRFVGVRPPKFPTVFEAIINAVACQQLSLSVGIHLLNRLSARFGSVPVGVRGASRAFPEPQELAGAEVAELRGLGFSRTKAATAIGIAERFAAGDLQARALGELSDSDAKAVLVAIPGIGRWSAEYTLLRGLGRLAILPGDDVGARNSLRRRFSLTQDARYEHLSALSRRWSPYGGIVYFHLLLDALAEAGLVVPTSGAPHGRGTVGKTDQTELL
ncbi:MAG: DNA-3-methyladenine glycosylase family protein [Acidimicrobiales bacterium]